MLDLYTWPTPNGHKVHIMLEELGVEYNVIPIDIWAGEQFSADFLRISPNNKMPALVDHDGPDGAPISIFESGAILLYLAEKHRRLLPQDARGRWEVMQWLMFQMSSVGPLLGQAHHFRGYAPEKIEYAIDRYTNEAGRIYRVLDGRLADREYLAGEYSVADIATFPWLRPHERQGQTLSEFPNVERWFRAIERRPAVERGVQVLADRRHAGPLSAEARANMFGARQYARRQQ